MKWLSRLLSGFLAIALTVSAVAWVSDSTLWNSDYVLETANSQKLYDGVAEALPDILIGPNTTGDQRFLLSQLITPSLVRRHLESAIAGLQRYYRNGGNPPSIDLSDVKLQFDTLRLAPPPMVASLISAPISLSNPTVDAIAQGASKQTSQLLWLAPAVSALLIALILFIARRRRWNVLAGSAFGAAVLTIIASGISLLLPGIATTSLSASVWGKLAPAVKSFSDAIAQDVSQRLLWIAVGFGSVAVLLAIVGLVIAASHKMRRHHDKPTLTE